jgi:hypothetical protein
MESATLFMNNLVQNDKEHAKDYKILIWHKDFGKPLTWSYCKKCGVYIDSWKQDLFKELNMHISHLVVEITAPVEMEMCLQFCVESRCFDKYIYGDYDKNFVGLEDLTQSDF